MLIDQRKFLLRDDTRDLWAKWIGFKPRSTVVDVGCGLGYLGYTFWPFFGQESMYIGVDIRNGLLEAGQNLSKEWAIGGATEFILGDAYSLPLPDNAVDLAMCQIVLIHLQDPKLALSEMMRVVRPGGAVVCVEPDNLSNALMKVHWSLPDLSIEDELLNRKIQLIAARGRIKLGRGDNSFGNKVPIVMNELGLEEIDIRTNDRVRYLYPPYENEMQQNLLEMISKYHLDEKTYAALRERLKEEFQAGGGSPEDLEKYLSESDRLRPTLQEQIESRKYKTAGGGFVYITKGRKPS